jgi:transcriptional regulator with XRE-family HTH domain
MISTTRSDPKFDKSYGRATLRSAFHSLFWAVLKEKRKNGSFTFKELAKQLGTNKAEVSRWFNGDPNWTINTIANLAQTLDVQIKIQAIDHTTGVIFSPAGPVVQIPKQAQSSIRKSMYTDPPVDTHIVKKPPGFDLPAETSSRAAA